MLLNAECGMKAQSTQGMAPIVQIEKSEISELSNALPDALSALHRISSVQYRESSIQNPASSQHTPQRRQDSTWQAGVVSSCLAR